MSKEQGAPRATSPRPGVPALVHSAPEAEAPTTPPMVAVQMPEPTIDPRSTLNIEGVTTADGRTFFRFRISDPTGVKFGHVPTETAQQIIDTLTAIKAELDTGLVVPRRSRRSTSASAAGSPRSVSSYGSRDAGSARGAASRISRLIRRRRGGTRFG